MALIEVPVLIQIDMAAAMTDQKQAELLFEGLIFRKGFKPNRSITFTEQMRQTL